MQRDAPVAGDADRIFLVVGAGQREDGVVDAGAESVAGAMGVDLVAARAVLVEMAAMIDLARKCRAGKIVGEGKAQILHQTKDTIDIVVGVDRGEIVAARVVFEILAGRPDRRRHFRRRHVGDRYARAAQGLDAVDGRGEAFELDRAAPAVERGTAGIRGRAAQRRRIGLEHPAHDVGDERISQQHRRGVDFDDRHPMQRPHRRKIEAEIDGADDVILAVADRSMHRRQRQGGVAGRRPAGAFGRRDCAPARRLVVAKDHEFLGVDGQRHAAADDTGET